MNEKPLDLENLEKWIDSNILDDSYLRELLIKEIKQRIKEACKFYLRYKDHPKLLVKEHPEYKKEFDKFFTSYYKIFYEYNKWLFKLTFKPVFEKVKNE